MRLIVYATKLEAAAQAQAGQGTEYAPNVPGNTDGRPTDQTAQQQLAGVPMDAPLAIIDREDWAHHDLLTIGPAHQRAVGTYCQQLKIYKIHRPHTEFMHYAFTQGNPMPLQTGAAIAITEHLAGLCPNFYPRYPDRLPASDKARMIEAVKQALDLGAMTGLPVYPVVTDRCHHEAAYMLHEATDAMLREHIQTLCGVEHNGKRIGGFIYWNTDRYWRTFAAWTQAQLNAYTGAQRENYARWMAIAEGIYGNAYRNADGSRNEAALTSAVAERQIRTLNIIRSVAGIRPSTPPDATSREPRQPQRPSRRRT